jgi:HPt (histidine-containing phosphotransfer) domain-containing protein
MERVAWTDERLDDLARRVDAGFERIDREIRELRSELRSEMAAMRAELRGEIAALRSTTNRVGGGIIVGLIVAVLTNSI